MARAPKPDEMVPTWCQPCIFGEHENCYDKAWVGTFSRGGPEGSCECRHKLNHQVPPEFVDTCRESVSPEMWHGSHPCGKKVKPGYVVVRRPTWGGMKAETREFPACGIHGAAFRRRQANDQKRAEEYAASDARRTRDKESKRAAEDWVRRLQEEHGVSSHVAQVEGRHTGAVAVQGEWLHGILTELATLQREMGLDPTT